MNEKQYHLVKSRCFPLVVAVFTIVVQATAQVQIGTSSFAAEAAVLRLVNSPRFNPNAMDTNNQALLALVDVIPAPKPAVGGLWLSGDAALGYQHLQWIAGDQPAKLLQVSSSGKVSFNLAILANAAGITNENIADQQEIIASYVQSNEGLRLLVEITYGSYRFLLHVGTTMPTLGGLITNISARNIDNRFDSRINPRRPKGQKLNNECPPEGFDSLIAVNPYTEMFNFHSEQLMPMSQVVFHELAEAHARLVLGLDYLPKGNQTGAHEVALNREIRLKQERPSQFIVVPVGYNLLLVSRDDWLHLDKYLRNQKGSKSIQKNK
jgi:hypothetical protein